MWQILHQQIWQMLYQQMSRVLWIVMILIFVIAIIWYYYTKHRSNEKHISALTIWK